MSAHPVPGKPRYPSPAPPSWARTHLSAEEQRPTDHAPPVSPAPPIEAQRK